MKSLYTIIIITFFSVAAFAQEFSFQLLFVSENGHRDSVTLGYDFLATDSLDALFNEENILGQPYDSVLDVRATNKILLDAGSMLFQSKKQIVGYNCPFNWMNYYAHLIELDIKSKYWPLKVYWNKLLFADSCKNGSVLTSVVPGGWWDTGGQQVILAATDSTELDASQYGYVDGTDTLRAFWVGISDSALLWEGIETLGYNGGIRVIYPNPTHQTETLEYTLEKNESLTIALYDVNGKLIRNFISNEQREAGEHKETLNIGELASGNYFLTISNGEQKMTVKMVKQ